MTRQTTIVVIGSLRVKYSMYTCNLYLQLAKDSLTVGNIPRCLCMICLEHFFEGELFTRTDCYHYFHKSCLARYVQHFLSNSTEPETKKLTLHMNQEQRKVILQEYMPG